MSKMDWEIFNSTVQNRAVRHMSTGVRELLPLEDIALDHGFWLGNMQESSFMPPGTHKASSCLAP